MHANLTRPELNLNLFHGIVTVAPQMLALLERIRRAARSDATVLVRGASGTGKELVATALHAESPRANHPFQAVNCATFTPELLASELFGHVRGAFTGAVRDKAGMFAQADRGTLFLDEVAELPLDIQARLLRVLQQRRFIPVGATSELEVDVRIVSATNAPLRKLVAEGRFREDLMYRIRVVVLYLPRLIERDGDLEALTWYFIDQFNARSGSGLRRVHAIEPAAWEAMRAYAWPGNIRELRNNLEQAFVLGEGPILRLEELAPEILASDDLGSPPAPVAPPVGSPPTTVGSPPTAVGGGGSAPAVPAGLTLESLQRAQLVEVFQKTGGRREEMAALLGVSRSTLYRRLKQHGLV